MVDTTEEVEVSESQIAAHWQEEELIHPSAAFIAQANMADSAVHERFKQENFPEYFREYADLLSWDQYWHTTLDTANPPFWRWFVGGKLNASATLAPDIPAGLLLVANCDLIRIRRVARRRRSWQQVGYSRAT